MRNYLLALAILIAATATAQQPKADYPIKSTFKAADTAIVVDGAKFVMIAGKTYSIEAFQKAHPVFMPSELWPLVITIIDKRSYGDLPASQILQLLQIIGQQLPQEKNIPK